MDYAKEYPVAMKVIAEWIEKGLLKRKFHIVNGLDAAPSALPLLYSGGNTGKLCLMFFFPATVPFSYFASPGSSRFLNTKSYPSFELCDPSLTVTPPRVCAVLPWSSPGSIHSRLTRAPSSWGPFCACSKRAAASRCPPLFRTPIYQFFHLLAPSHSHLPHMPGRCPQGSH